MPRRRVGIQADHVFHVINRGVWRAQLFHQDGDYTCFRTLLASTLQRVPVRLFAYCLMPNHFHLVCMPGQDGQLSDFMRLLTQAHSKRWHAARGTTGTGPVYQGRFRAFAVQTDAHFLTVCRYVERNPLRAGLVRRAEEWPWSSLSDRWKISNEVALSDWPICQPDDWLSLVNGSEPDLEAVRRAVLRNRPFGSAGWIAVQFPGKDSRNLIPESSPGFVRTGRPSST
jgi:putative transposase